MNTLNDGGLAFPSAEQHTPEGLLNYPFEPGMTLLDYFAAKAMQSLLAKNYTAYKTTGELAIEAWVLADTMIQAKASFLAAKAEFLASKSVP